MVDDIADSGKSLHLVLNYLAGQGAAEIASDKGYATYLREIKDIYAQLRSRMRPAGTAVIEVANIKRNGRVTTLAWDIAAVVSQVLHFEGEVVVGWDRYGYGYEHSYCLVFTAL